MTRNTMTVTRRAASWVATTALAFGAAAGVGVAAALPAAADAPAASEQAARFEVDFLKDMIDHHHMAVMMGEMCVEQAVHPDLQSTCESIVAAQSAEIETMQGWLQDWYGVTYEPDMTGMQSMHRFHDLTGEDFETAFMRSMIRHHWGAIREADKCLTNAEHPELVGMCEDIRVAQLGEIEQMQTWLQEWYGVPGGRPIETA